MSIRYAIFLYDFFGKSIAMAHVGGQRTSVFAVRGENRSLYPNGKINLLFKRFEEGFKGRNFP